MAVGERWRSTVGFLVLSTGFAAVMLVEKVVRTPSAAFSGVREIVYVLLLLWVLVIPLAVHVRSDGDYGTALLHGSGWALLVFGIFLPPTRCAHSSSSAFAVTSTSCGYGLLETLMLGPCLAILRESCVLLLVPLNVLAGVLLLTYSLRRSTTLGGLVAEHLPGVTRRADGA